jgi:hypothetical protein
MFIYLSSDSPIWTVTVQGYILEIRESGLGSRNSFHIEWSENLDFLVMKKTV